MRNIILLFVQITILLSCATAQNQVLMGATTSTSVSFVFTDSIGNRCGADPRGEPDSTKWKRYDEIPNASYASFQSYGSVDPAVEPDYWMEFAYYFYSLENEGKFLIHLYGAKRDTFHLCIGVYTDFSERAIDYELNTIPIEKDSTITFEFIFHSDPNAPNSFRKLVSARSLIQDVAVMRKMNWIYTQSIADKYINLFTDLGQQIQSQDYIAARSSLTSALTELRSDSVTNISGKAFELLKKDVEQLIIELPKDMVPSINSLNPLYWLSNNGAFTLTVNGKNFSSRSTIIWNQSARTTICISDSVLQATILAADVAVAGTAQVAVVTGSDTSNILTFPILQLKVSVLLDTLIAAKHRCAANGPLGDKNFVNELDNGLENAKKHLVRNDSVNCAKELTQVKEKLLTEYKKTPANPKRFLTKEGYDILIPVIDYVLRQLPSANKVK
ncbi:MAG: IPT/TIG domain-containing protein [bacterium]